MPGERAAGCSAANLQSTLQPAFHDANTPAVPSTVPSSAHAPAEGDGAKGVAALVLEQAGAELREAAKEEAKRHSHLSGALGLRQLRLGALQQRCGQRKAVEAQGRCGKGVEGGWVGGVTNQEGQTG